MKPLAKRFNSVRLTQILHKQKEFLPSPSIIFIGITDKNPKDLLTYVKEVIDILLSTSEEEFMEEHFLPLIKLIQHYMAWCTQVQMDSMPEENISQLQELIVCTQKHVKIVSSDLNEPEMNYLNWAVTHLKTISKRHENAFIFDSYIFNNIELIFYGIESPLEQIKWTDVALFALTTLISNIKIEDLKRAHLLRCELIIKEVIKKLDSYQHQPKSSIDVYIKSYEQLEKFTNTLIQGLSTDQKALSKKKTPIVFFLKTYLLDCYFKLTRDYLHLIRSKDGAEHYLKLMEEALKPTFEQYTKNPKLLEFTEVTEIARYFTLKTNLLILNDIKGNNKDLINSVNNELVNFYEKFKRQPQYNIDHKCIAAFNIVLLYFVETQSFHQAAELLLLIENSLKLFKSVLSKTKPDVLATLKPAFLYQFIEGAEVSNAETSKVIRSAINKMNLEILNKNKLFQVQFVDTNTMAIIPLSKKTDFFNAHKGEVFNIINQNGITVRYSGKKKKNIFIEGLEKLQSNILEAKLINISKEINLLPEKLAHKEIKLKLNQIKQEKQIELIARCDLKPLIETKKHYLALEPTAAVELKEILKEYQPEELKPSSIKLIDIKDYPMPKFPAKKNNTSQETKHSKEEVKTTEQAPKSKHQTSKDHAPKTSTEKINPPSNTKHNKMVETTKSTEKEKIQSPLCKTTFISSEQKLKKHIKTHEVVKTKSPFFKSEVPPSKSNSKLEEQTKAPEEVKTKSRFPVKEFVPSKIYSKPLNQAIVPELEKTKTPPPKSKFLLHNKKLQEQVNSTEAPVKEDVWTGSYGLFCYGSTGDIFKPTLEDNLFPSTWQKK